VWWQCRSCRPPSFLNPNEASSAAGPSRGAVKKGSTSFLVFGQQGGMFQRPFHFVRDAEALRTALFPSSSRRVRNAAAWAR